MLYSLILIDKPGGAQLRNQIRPEHKAYLGGVASEIAVAGPLTSDDGQTMIGSLLASTLRPEVTRALGWQMSPSIGLVSMSIRRYTRLSIFGHKKPDFHLAIEGVLL